jgi:hypothetical protein
VGLVEQTGVEHDILGTDDVAAAVMNIDRAYELVIGFHGRPPDKGRVQLRNN